jgi:hypothetical protein
MDDIKFTNLLESSIPWQIVRANRPNNRWINARMLFALPEQKEGMAKSSSSDSGNCGKRRRHKKETDAGLPIVEESPKKEKRPKKLTSRP